MFLYLYGKNYNGVLCIGGYDRPRTHTYIASQHNKKATGGT